MVQRLGRIAGRIEKKAGSKFFRKFQEKRLSRMACIELKPISPILDLPQNDAPRVRAGDVGELA